MSEAILALLESLIRHREAALAAVAIQGGLHWARTRGSWIAAGLKPLAMTMAMSEGQCPLT